MKSGLFSLSDEESSHLGALLYLEDREFEQHHAEMENVVFIIESPGKGESSWGKPLSDTLKLSGIPCTYRQVRDTQDFEAALQEMAREIRPELDENGIWCHKFPYIHFCMHGDRDGVALNGDELIPWEKLKTLLVDACAFAHFDESEGIAFLGFSACEGMHAREMLRTGSRPCLGMIGSDTVITMSGSVVGFATFYYDLLGHRRTVGESLWRMNQAVQPGKITFWESTQVTRDGKIDVLTLKPTRNPGKTNWRDNPKAYKEPLVPMYTPGAMPDDWDEIESVVDEEKAKDEDFSPDDPYDF